MIRHHPSGGGGGGTCCAVVQGVGGSTHNGTISKLTCAGTNCSIAFPNNTTTGNTILVGLVWAVTGSTASCADTTNGTYTAGTQWGDNSHLSDTFVQYFVKANITGATTPTVTCTISASSGAGAISIKELSGGNTTTPIDQQAGSNYSTTSPPNPVNIGSVTTTAGHDFIDVMTACDTATSCATAGSGFTLDYSGSYFYYNGEEFEAVTSNGTYSGIWAGAAGAGWIGAMIALK